MKLRILRQVIAWVIVSWRFLLNFVPKKSRRKEPKSNKRRLEDRYVIFAASKPRDQDNRTKNSNCEKSLHVETTKLTISTETILVFTDLRRQRRIVETTQKNQDLERIFFFITRRVRGTALGYE